MRRNNQRRCSCAFSVTVMQSCDTERVRTIHFWMDEIFKFRKNSQICSNAQETTHICFLPTTIAEMRHLKSKAVQQAMFCEFI